jgi:hypothetical protein
LLILLPFQTFIVNKGLASINLAYTFQQRQEIATLAEIFATYNNLVRGQVITPNVRNRHIRWTSVFADSVQLKCLQIATDVVKVRAGKRQ